MSAHLFTAIARTCLILAGVLAFGSCAIVPATVKRIGFAGQRHCPFQSMALSELLTESLDDPASDESAHALAHFVEEWKIQRGDTREGEVSVEGPDGQIRRYAVRFSGAHGSFPLSYFDEISPAIDYKVKKIPHHRRDGVGGPLVAMRENRGTEPIEVWYPDEGISRPITAVIDTGKMVDGVQEIQIELLCPLLNDEITVDGESRALAADLSVPWAALLARAGALEKSRVADLLDPTPTRDPRLYLMEPYDPDKEPLIMIHGLLATPLSWAGLSNELWADDAIRSRYQIWHYLYNTSAPALYSGRILSNQLQELRLLLDPSGKDAAMQSTTIIAHSMGGIVTRRLITRPGNVFWEAGFTRPFESLKLSEDDRGALQRAFFWESEKHIKRVIYIASPHLGSAYADSFAGRVGIWLVKPPNRFKDFYARISAANPGAFTPAYESLGQGELDSVNALSPKQPTLKILADLPNGHPVREFSIIGNRGKAGPLIDSSDGIVPYTSSHLDRAESELIVPSDHGAIDHEQTVEEVKRILKLP